MEEEEIPQFAARIKQKFPDYADVDDYELVERTVRKYPSYAKKVKLPSDFKLLKATTGYQNLDDLYEQAGREEGVDPNLLLEQGRQESINFNPDVVYGRRDSPKGARGLGQFMPGTAPTYGLVVNDKQDDRADPTKAVRAQAKYMRKLLDQFNGDENLALAGYNAGEYRDSLKNGQIPNIKETQDYVKIIGGNLKKAREAKTKALREYYQNQAQNAIQQQNQVVNQPEIVNQPTTGEIINNQIPVNTVQPDLPIGTTETPEQHKNALMLRQQNLNPNSDEYKRNAEILAGLDNPVPVNPQNAVLPVQPEIVENKPILDESSDDNISYNALGQVHKQIRNHTEIGKNYLEFLKASGLEDSDSAIKQFNDIQQLTAKNANLENQKDFQPVNVPSSLSPDLKQTDKTQPTDSVVTRTGADDLRESVYGKKEFTPISAKLRYNDSSVNSKYWVRSQIDDLVTKQVSGALPEDIAAARSQFPTKSNFDDVKYGEDVNVNVKTDFLNAVADARDRRLAGKKAAIANLIAQNEDLVNLPYEKLNKEGITFDEVWNEFQNPSDDLMKSAKEKRAIVEQGKTRLEQIDLLVQTGQLTKEQGEQDKIKEVEARNKLQKDFDANRVADDNYAWQAYGMSGADYNKIVKNPNSIDELLKQNGAFSAKDFLEQQERKRQAELAAWKKILNRPDEAAVEFTKNLIRVIPKTLSSLSKAVSIGAEGLEYLFGQKGTEAKDKAFFKLGKYIDQETDRWMPQDPVLRKNFLVSTLPDSVGQLLVSLGAGFATGGVGVPLLIGATSGGTQQYEEAERFNASKGQRLLAGLTGAIAAAPDAILQAKWLKLLTPLEKSGFLGRLASKFFGETVEKIGEEEAKTLTRQLLSNMLKGGLFEGSQEVAENKINDALAALTYDKKRKVLTISDNDIESFLAGFVGGVGGGGIETTIENYSPAEIAEKTKIEAEAKISNLEKDTPIAEKVETDEPFVLDKVMMGAETRNQLKEKGYSDKEISQFELKDIDRILESEPATLSPIERRSQVSELDKLGFSSKEIDKIGSADAKEIVENKYSPADWKDIQETEAKLSPSDFKLEDKVNGKNETKTEVQEPASVDEKSLVSDSEIKAPKLKASGGDNDGDVNQPSKSPVKVEEVLKNSEPLEKPVKVAVEAPKVETKDNKITVTVGETVKSFTNNPVGQRRANRYAKQVEIEQKFEQVKDNPKTPAYSLAKSNTLTNDLVGVVERDFTGEDLQKARIFPDGRINQEAFKLMSEAHKEAFGQSEPQIFHGVYLNPSDVKKVRAAFLQVLSYAAPGSGRVTQRLFNQFNATINPRFNDAIHIVTSNNTPNGLDVAWQEETAHAQDYRVGVQSSVSINTFPKNAVGRRAMMNVAKNYPKASKAYLAREVGAKILRADAETELNLTSDEVSHLRELQYNSWRDAGVTDQDIKAALGEVVKAGEYYEKLERESNQRNQGNGERSDEGRSGKTGEAVSGVREETPSEPAYSKISIKDFIEEAKKQDSDFDVEVTKENEKALEEAIATLVRDDVFTTITNLRRAGMLTGVRTHLKNVSSNAIFQGTEEMSKVFGYFADVLAATKTGQRTISFVDPAAVAKSFRAVFKADSITKESGIEKAFQILRGGDTKENLEKQQLRQANSGLKALDWYVNSVFRTLGAEDALFKVYAFRRSLEEQAKTLAITAKREHSSLNIKEYRNQLLANPDAYMVAEANLYADFATFQNKNPLASSVNDFTKWLKEKGFLGKVAALGVETAIPFTNTPSNVLARVLDYSPAGYYKSYKGYKSFTEGTNKAKSEADTKSVNRQQRFNDKLKSLRKREDAKLDTRIENFTDTLNSIQERLKVAKPNVIKKLQAKESQIAEALRKAKQEKQIVAEKRKFSDLGETEQREAIDEITQKLFTRKEQQKFSSNFGRASLGTTAMALGFLLAQQGFLSGVWGYDDDDREKNQEFKKRKEQGIENGSLLIPKVGRIVILDSPLGKSLTLGATVYEQINTPREKGEGAEKFLGDIKDSLWTLATEQPLIKAGEDYTGSKKTLGERAGGLIGSFVPTIISDVGEALDKEPRKSKGFKNSVLRRIPIVREKAEISSWKVSKEERGGILRRAVRAVDPFNTRSPKVYKYGK